MQLNNTGVTILSSSGIRVKMKELSGILLLLASVAVL